MLSPMAEEDIKYLEGLGVTLTPAQVVRLNDLALRVERGPEASAFARAPRVAWAGSTPVYEPTVAAERWLDDFGLHWWHGASAVLATAWACAHCHRPGFFGDKTREPAVRRMIEAWQDGLDCTVPQLMIAVDYAVHGDSPPERTESPSGEPTAADGCPHTDLLNEALAANLGASSDELLAMPRRIVEDMLRRWLRNQVALAGGKTGALDARGASRAYCAYDDYLESLKPKEEPGVEG